MQLAAAIRRHPAGLAGLACTLGLVLLGRAAALQLTSSNAAANASLEAERRHGAAMVAPRGRILDARGVVLATSEAHTRVLADGAPAAVLGHPAKRATAHEREEPATGLELAFDKELRASTDVTVTLDLALSREAGSVLGRAGISRAAVVILDPRDGAVRAALTVAAEGDEERAIDATRNRALPPGSLVFPFLALEARSRGVKPAAACNGAWLSHGRAYACTHIHGALDSPLAIEQGCSVHFLRMGEALGFDGVTDTLTRAGLVERGGIALRAAPDDSSATGDLANASLGQGTVRTTPLAVAVAYAALANGGTVLAPRVRAADPAVTQAALPGHDALGSITEALRARARAMGGPSSVAATFAVGETPRADDGSEAASARWFVGYAPAAAPRALVVVVSESARQTVNEAGFALVAAAIEGARP